MLGDRRMIFKEADNGVIFLTSDFFPDDTVKFGFSTRFGGVSRPPFKSLNLGFGVADDYQNVVENRYKFVHALGGNPRKVVSGEQVHGNTVSEIKTQGSNEILEGLTPGLKQTDGLVTTVSQIPLIGGFADCVPIFLYETDIPLVGIVHAGWRGSLNGIAIEALKTISMVGGKPENVKVLLGPSIGPCCYRVGEEVYNKACNFTYREQVFARSNPGYHLDLKRLNEIQFIENGVLENNILTSEMCTCCDNDLFFSYRKDQHNTGRMMGLIYLR